MGKLDDKIAFISGGASGMGAAEARMFVAEGARVLIADKLDDAGQALASELGENALYSHLDVCDQASWVRAIAHAEQHFGKLNVLINNAGILLWQLIEDMTLEAYKSVVDVNQIGCWLGMKTALPALRRSGGGAIVNTASLAGRMGMAQGSAYVASKHAVLGMSKCAAIEFGKYNIRVNAILPGAIETQMAGKRKNTDAGEHVKAFSDLPIGRIGTVEEVARLVTFLASDAATYCTGGEFLIDGGMALRGG